MFRFRKDVFFVETLFLARLFVSLCYPMKILSLALNNQPPWLTQTSLFAWRLFIRLLIRIFEINLLDTLTRFE